MPARGTEQPALAVIDDARGVDIGAQRLSKRVMARHGVLLAAFLMQPDRPAGATGPEVFDLHFQGRVDAREAVGEGGDQRAVAQIATCRGWNGVEQLASFGALEHRCLASLDDLPRPAHGRRRIIGDHLADDEPVNQHPHSGKLLFDGRRPPPAGALYT